MQQTTMKSHNHLMKHESSSMVCACSASVQTQGASLVAYFTGDVFTFFAYFTQKN